MDPFSYLVVLTSIILGLGVTRIVGGLGHLMQKRKTRRPYWVHALWLLNLLLTITTVWWFAYRWRDYERWTFFLFLWLLLSPVVLYLIASLLFPDLEDEQPITDWRGYFYDNHRDIFLLFALVFPIDIIDTLLKGMAHFRDQGPLYFFTMSLLFTLCLIAAFAKNARYHSFFAILFLVYNLCLLGGSVITQHGVFVPALSQPGR
jgi:hypothetical protein